MLLYKTKTHIGILLVALLFASPLPVHGTGTLEVEVSANDSVAGLGTDIEVRNIEGDAILAILPPYGAELIQEINGDTNMRIAGEETEEAGIYYVEVRQENVLLAETRFGVLADSVDLTNSSIQASNDILDIDRGDELEVSVILRDRYGNTISDRPVKLISNRSSDIIQEITSQTDASGEQLFIVAAEETGTITLRALDLFSGNVLVSDVQLTAQSMRSNIGGYTPPRNMYYNTNRTYGSQLVGNVAGRALYGQVSSFDLIDSFILDAPRETRVNLDENLTITAIDRNGQIVEDYTGTVQLASTDPNAVLPSFGEVTFRGSDLGRKTLHLGLRFSTPGEHILYAEDSKDSSISGETTINIIGDTPFEPEQTIDITNPAQDAMVNELDILIEGTAPPFVNLIVTGGAEDNYGESDSDGYFAINVELNESQVDHTLRVRDESGRHDSGNLRLKLDVEAPDVLKFTFTPSSPTEGEDILVVAKVYDNGQSVESVKLKVTEEDEYTLEPVKSASGTYQLLFSIMEDGTYQPVLTVRDAAGNKREILSTLEVRKKGLPQIQNVRVKAEPNAAALEWDAMILEEDPVTGYRIYIGESPTDFSYTLDTEADTTAAHIAGLKPGATYYFAVTAVRDDTESIHKSDVVQATIIGLTLTVKPGNGTLSLEWTELPKEIPLSHYMLDYGVDSTAYSEHREINGSLSKYTLRDLLNDITYYVRITPVTTTGEILEDLAVDGEGTPTSQLGGFQPGPADPIPLGLGTIIKDTPPLHAGAPPPRQPITGIPSSKWWIIVTVVLCVGWFYRRRQHSIRTTDSFMQSMQTKYNGEWKDVPRR